MSDLTVARERGLSRDGGGGHCIPAGGLERSLGVSVTFLQERRASFSANLCEPRQLFMQLKHILSCPSIFIKHFAQ